AVRANDASCTRRPRVAVVMRPVPPDVGHLDRLAREFDVLAYFGKGDPPKAHPGPRAVDWRRMDWVIAPRRGGHLHWVYPELKRVLQVDRPDLVHVIS